MSEITQIILASMTCFLLIMAVWCITKLEGNERLKGLKDLCLATAIIITCIVF